MISKNMTSAAVPISGYASVFRVQDGAGDVIAPGAFTSSLARRSAGSIAMLWQHDPANPIGRWTDINEDRRGLRVAGYLLLDVARGREAAVLVGAGALTGLSIGFKTVRAGRRRGGHSRILHEVDLWEISLVTFPQADGARVRLRSGANAPTRRGRNSAVRAVRTYA